MGPAPVASLDAPLLDAPLTEEETCELLNAPGSATTGQQGVPSTASLWWKSLTQQASLEVSDPTSWKSILQLLTSSVRASANHVQSLSLETLALGWVPLMKQHEGVTDRIQGRVVTDRALVSALLVLAQWADAAYDAMASPAHLSFVLGVKLPDVIYICQGQSSSSSSSSSFSSTTATATSSTTSASTTATASATSATTSASSSSLPGLPAYYLVVSHDARAVRLVVRGTSALTDLVTDLCGHTVPFLQGHAHYGMMRAAQALVTAEVARLSQVTQAYPGYQVQLIGHSLGGGVAALAACMLHHVPELQSQLHGARVTAVTFATPPVVTEHLARSCALFITTVVNDNDMVARTSIATIAELSTAMETAKTQAMQNSEVMSILQRSGAVVSTQALAKAAFKHYAMAKPAAYVAQSLAKGPMMRGMMGVGLQLAGTALVTALTASAANAVAASPTGGPGAITSPAADAARGGSATSATSPAAAAATASADSLIASATAAKAAFGSALSMFSSRVKSEAAALKSEAKAAGVDGKQSFSDVVAQVAAAAAASTMVGADGLGTAGAGAGAGPAGAGSGANVAMAGVKADAGSRSVPAAAAGAGGTAAGGAGTADGAVASGSSASRWFTAANVQSLRLLGGALLNKVEESLAKPGEEAGNAAGAAAGAAAAVSPGAAGGVASRTVSAGQQGAGIRQESSPTAGQGGGKGVPAQGTAAGGGAGGAGAGGAGAGAGGGSVTGAPSASVMEAGGMGVDITISGEEDQRLHRLFCPGKLYHIQREGTEPDVRHSMVEGDGHQAFQRLLLKRSMLKDHYLAQYLSSLKKVEEQLRQ